MAVGVRLARARPVHENAVGDGYVHYACAGVKRVPLAAKRAVDIAVSGLALLLLAHLMTVPIVLTGRGES